MWLASLTVRAFRNLASLDVDLPPEGCVIVGGNGHGKTNLLEAIYYLVLFRSLRGARDRELVRFGEPGFFLGADRRTGGRTDGNSAPAESPPRRVTAGYEMAGGRKKVTVDGAETRKLSEAVGQLLAVSFSPADVALVAAGPSARRRYLDVLLSVSEQGYLSRLSALRSALKQRNAALRRGKPEEARAFDGPLAESAARVSLARHCWAERWQARFSELCRALGEVTPTSLRHHTQVSPGEGADGWLKALAYSQDRDARRGSTTVGPHRDDLRLSLGEHDLGTYGSAGQHRTAAVALRLLEAESLRASHGTAPTALYDDVFAELDGERQERLLELIREVLPGQAMVVAPRDAEVPGDLLDRPRWRIREGVLEH
ncbi:MAG TPA: DNA replication and repair protein RecF [Gemmatimonadales bacterium]|nr:DNA replication and repair protein RecF [Gemmatimonadales bacterium]